MQQSYNTHLNLFLGFQKRDNNNSHLLVVLKLEMASRAVTMKSNAVIDLSGGIESIRVQLQSLSVLPFPILLVRFLRPCQSTHPAERPLPNNTLLPTLLPPPTPPLLPVSLPLTPATLLLQRRRQQQQFFF